ncbi:glycoside hydrolase family 31 protein [Schizophyllum commune Tattone D]|nr:glycoside hydrolase family 31 protein [Schizophyllum commune Tattone D]
MYVDPARLDACAGYTLASVEQADNRQLRATLRQAGDCGVFGDDIPELNLEVTYETNQRIHMKITDAANQRYEIPEDLIPRPGASDDAGQDTAEINFNYTESPFSFTVFRTSTDEVLFNTASHPLIFEDQYLRVKTSLPDGANIYGLGEHTHGFRLDNYDTTLTLFARDAPFVPTGTNLYGSHPIYQEHRPTGTHGVLLLNSNGMDIKLNDTDGVTTLEYNVVGGMLDFYFFVGSESDPTAVARQYAEVVGTPAEIPYWSFGLHQCRYGYQNFVDLADVITGYADAGIPLETMWTDIDYMHRRRVFSLDPDYFPLDRMQEIVKYLHDHEQKYIMMTDPGVAYVPGENYEAYNKGIEMDIFLKQENGSDFLALVWPGVTVYPDWFHEKTQEYWSLMYAHFFDPDTGIDADGSWIDMNEPSNVSPATPYPRMIQVADNPTPQMFDRDSDKDIFQQAKDGNLPPERNEANKPDHDAPIFQNGTAKRPLARRDIMDPPYDIDNAYGELSVKTADSKADDVEQMNIKHQNGLVEYDTHNLFGLSMSKITRQALLGRRPGLRPFVLSRSTLASTGRHVAHWLGDNESNWDQYRNSIANILAMAGVYQVPMNLCARWAALGAFYPFMRNHNGDSSISQEYYLWETVTNSAKNAIEIRYRLLDYFYTALHKQHLDGTPAIAPLWHYYPKDANTYAIDTQFFFGPHVMVSPILEENSESRDAYFPNDIFYDWYSLTALQGSGADGTMNADITSIPVHIRGGSILPLRVKGAMTTAALRRTNFELVVAVGLDGTAEGSLYIDDGVSIEQQKTTEVTMKYDKGTLTVDGTFDYDVGDVKLERVRVLGVGAAPGSTKLDGEEVEDVSFNQSNGIFDVPIDRPLGKFTLVLS